MIPPNDHTVVISQLQNYSESAVTVILHSPVTFCMRRGLWGFEPQLSNGQKRRWRYMSIVSPINHTNSKKGYKKLMSRSWYRNRWSMSNQWNQCPLFIYWTKRKGTETSTNFNNIGLRHSKTQGTRKPIRQYKRESYTTYATVVLIGRTQCSNSMK